MGAPICFFDFGLDLILPSKPVSAFRLPSPYAAFTSNLRWPGNAARRARFLRMNSSAGTRRCQGSRSKRKLRFCQTPDSKPILNEDYGVADINEQPFAALNPAWGSRGLNVCYTCGGAWAFIPFMMMISVLLALPPLSAKQTLVSKHQVQLSTGYGQIVLDPVSLIQSDKFVSVSGTIDNMTGQAWNQVVLTLTFYGKSGNVLPPEPDVSTLVRIQHLRRGEVRKFSEQIPWRIIHHKLRLPKGRITDFVVTYDSDDSHPLVADHKSASR
jgi:hypothetical protein